MLELAHHLVEPVGVVRHFFEPGAQGFQQARYNAYPLVALFVFFVGMQAPDQVVDHLGGFLPAMLGIVPQVGQEHYPAPAVYQDIVYGRSEERRVGKECRCRWWSDDYCIGRIDWWRA